MSSELLLELVRERERGRRLFSELEESVLILYCIKSPIYIREPRTPFAIVVRTDEATTAGKASSYLKKLNLQSPHLVTITS